MLYIHYQEKALQVHYSPPNRITDILVNLIMSGGGKQVEGGGFFFKPGDSIEIFKLMLWRDIMVYIKHEVPCRKTSNIVVALQTQMV